MRKALNILQVLHLDTDHYGSFFTSWSVHFSSFWIGAWDECFIWVCCGWVQSGQMASPHLTAEAVYLCTGNPMPKDIEQIAFWLLNESFSTSYQSILLFTFQRDLTLLSPSLFSLQNTSHHNTSDYLSCITWPAMLNDSKLSRVLSCFAFKIAFNNASLCLDMLCRDLRNEDKERPCVVWCCAGASTVSSNTHLISQMFNTIRKCVHPTKW